ncbi:Hypothetical predicted protein [Pelobates cultripes]|uniref:Uncharacterized protein n=1 Tax=Pelobates cultripes TaxID=61616 RepID=A0AAD1W6P8_PELCU|nr:Hypothetical predicted protein [Pelobates cultripes]
MTQDFNVLQVSLSDGTPVHKGVFGFDGVGSHTGKKNWHWKDYSSVTWPVSKRLNECFNEDLQTQGMWAARPVLELARTMLVRPGYCRRSRRGKLQDDFKDKVKKNKENYAGSESTINILNAMSVN